MPRVPSEGEVRSLQNRFQMMDSGVISHAIDRAMRRVQDYSDLPEDVQDEIAVLLAGHYLELYERAPTSFSVGGESFSFDMGSISDVLDMTICGKQIKQLVAEHRLTLVGLVPEEYHGYL